MINELINRVIAAREAPDAARPLVVGIAGGVGVGKTTLAKGLAAALRPSQSVAVLATDNFLYPNADLAARGLLMQKGFPATYDVDALRAAVLDLRSDRVVVVPSYSHQFYDRVDDITSVPPTDVLVIEGVNVLQPGVVDVVDLALYIDVDEEHARAWFFRRFEELCVTGEGFYARFAEMTRDEREAVAASAWNEINLVNLVEHIAPSRSSAHLVVRKDADHKIVAIERQRVEQPRPSTN